MTLHWWMHWFWITLIHSLVTLPLLLPGILSAPSPDSLHGIQSSVSTLPVPIGDASWEPKAEIGGGKEGMVVTEASDGGHISPPLLQNDQFTNVSPLGAVEESSSRADTEATSFLEKEDERSWGLEDPAPRPPFFLRSGYEEEEEEDEDDGIHLPAGMPWLPASVPRVEISSPSVRPTIIPSHEFPSSQPPTVEPWPANKTLDQSSAGESQPDVSEGGESGGRGPREQPQQPTPEPSLNSSSLPEAIVSSEALTTPSSIWTQYSSSLPSSHVEYSSPLYSEVYSSTQTYSDSTPSSILSDVFPSLSPSYSDSSSSPLHTGESSPSISQISQTVISDIPPTFSSSLIPSDTLSSDAVHSREGKAIGVSHIDQQPKQEQKQIEVVDGSEDTPSTTTTTTTTTVSPATVDVESSPVKSSSNPEATADVVGREDKDVKNESVTTDSSVPVKDASSSNSSEKVVEVDKTEDAHLPPAVDKGETEINDKKDVVSGRNETGSVNFDSSVVDKDVSNVGKPMKEEDIAPPVEVPTAVAVREGSVSIHSEVKDEQDGGIQTSEKDPILAAADVPSSVHQGRMTAPRSLDTASIVGISLGSVLLVGAVAGGVGFVLYRRSLYANKPQTLNDKCSNPDSSGYIDDTLRVSSACSANHGQRPQRSRMEMSRNGGPGKRGGGRGGGAEGGKERRQNGAKVKAAESCH